MRAGRERQAPGYTVITSRVVLRPTVNYSSKLNGLAPILSDGSDSIAKSVPRARPRAQSSEHRTRAHRNSPTAIALFSVGRFMVEVTKRFRDAVLLDKELQEWATVTLPGLVATWKVRLAGKHSASTPRRGSPT